jgi:CRP-like cAMP-binding protein
MEHSITEILTPEEEQALCRFAERQVFAKDEIIFEESTVSDQLYLIEEGEVSVYIQKYLETQEISRLSAGQCLGEMGVMDNVPRSASAKAVQPTVLLGVDKAAFESFINDNPEPARKVRLMMEARNAELALKESVIANTDLSAGDIHISMKGDPSLRETVFSRERYYSIVDEAMDKLEPLLEDMLLNRNVFRVMLNFNSGEIRIHTLFDPFTPEIHAANRLVSSNYIDRHFPLMGYDEKTRLVRRIYELIANDKYIGALSEYWKTMFVDNLIDWEPVSKARICSTIREIKTLRNLEQYYLRNISIGTVRDVIRMQFNCDGTHVVNSDDYQRFLQENLE